MIQRNENGQIVKGNIPWNKGLKGIHLSPNSGFKKGYIMSLKIKTKIGIANKGKMPWITGKNHTLETKRKMRLKALGRKLTEKSKKLISLHNKTPNGEKNPNWKGDKVKLSGLHMWVYSKLGRPNKCEFCGKIKRNLQWANKSHEYKRSLDDWLRLCVSCHKQYDLNYIKEGNNARFFI